MKTEILYGIHPVFEVLKAGRREIFEIYIAKDKTSKRIEKVAALAKSMAGTDLHQGIGSKTGPFPLTGISDIVDSIQRDEGDHLLLLLDNILDPNNLGALVRTALCVGVNGIVVPKDRSALPTPAVSKASAGALEHVRLARVTNKIKTIKTLIEKGMWIAGMDKASDRSVFFSDLTG